MASADGASEAGLRRTLPGRRVPRRRAGRCPDPRAVGRPSWEAYPRRSRLERRRDRIRRASALLAALGALARRRASAAEQARVVAGRRKRSSDPPAAAQASSPQARGAAGAEQAAPSAEAGTKRPRTAARKRRAAAQRKVAALAVEAEGLRRRTARLGAVLPSARNLQPSARGQRQAGGAWAVPALRGPGEGPGASAEGSPVRRGISPAGSVKSLVPQRAGAETAALAGARRARPRRAARGRPRSPAEVSSRRVARRTGHCGSRCLSLHPPACRARRLQGIAPGPLQTPRW